MKEFIHKHENRIQGVLSCFDRMLFRGYLPIMSSVVRNFPGLICLLWAILSFSQECLYEFARRYC